MSSCGRHTIAVVSELQRIIGVYNAEGTVFGELSYAALRAMGKAHCALCDVTHGTFRSRPEWTTARTSLGVPFDTYHRNDQPASVKAAAGDETPVVAAEFADGTIEVLLRGDDLEACAKSPERMMAAITAALEANGAR